MFVASVVTRVAVLERAEEPKVGLVKLERLRVERLVVVVGIGGGARIGFVCLVVRPSPYRQSLCKGESLYLDLPSSAPSNTFCEPAAGESQGQNQILVQIQNPKSIVSRGAYRPLQTQLQTVPCFPLSLEARRSLSRSSAHQRRGGTCPSRQDGSRDPSSIRCSDPRKDTWRGSRTLRPGKMDQEPEAFQ